MFSTACPESDDPCSVQVLTPDGGPGLAVSSSAPLAEGDYGIGVGDGSIDPGEYLEIDFDRPSDVRLVVDYAAGAVDGSASYELAWTDAGGDHVESLGAFGSKISLSQVDRLRLEGQGATVASLEYDRCETCDRAVSLSGDFAGPSWEDPEGLVRVTAISRAVLRDGALTAEVDSTTDSPILYVQPLDPERSYGLRVVGTGEIVPTYPGGAQVVHDDEFRASKPYETASVGAGPVRLLRVFCAP